VIGVSVRLDPADCGATCICKAGASEQSRGQKKAVESERAGYKSSMTTLLFILSLMGGCAAAWLCEKYFEPWRRAACVERGPRSHRAKLIAVCPIIGAVFAGMLATAFILIALG